MSVVNWMIVYGVDDSHLNECHRVGGNFGLFYKRKDAIKAFQEFEPIYPYKIVQIIRLVFETEYDAAGNKAVVFEKRLNTQSMLWEHKDI